MSIQSLVSQYNDKVTAINDGYEQIERDVRYAKSELNSAGAGRFLPVGGSIIEVITIDACFNTLESVKASIRENESTGSTLNGKWNELTKLYEEYSALMALGEAYT